MNSPTRQDCTAAVKHFAQIITHDASHKVLYVGIAGDPPGGEYAHMFAGEVSTFDADPKWNPQIVGDITSTDFVDESWDIIVMTQVIEHIPNIFDLQKEVTRILKSGGHLVVDCPWQYPYHAEPPSFGDYWRISKDGFRELFSALTEVEIISTANNTSCLFKK